MNLNLRAGMMGLSLFLSLTMGMAVACGAATQPQPAAEKAAPTAAQAAPAQPVNQEPVVKDTPELPAAEKAALMAVQVAPTQPAAQEPTVKDTPAPPMVAEKATPTAVQAASSQPAEQESAIKDTPAPPREIHIANTSPEDDVAGCKPDGDLLCTDWGPVGLFFNIYPTVAKNEARRNQLGIGDRTGRTVDWQTQNIRIMPGDMIEGIARPNAAEWMAMAEAAATAACLAQDAQYVAGSAYFGPGHSYDRGFDENDTGPGLGWFFRKVPHHDPGAFKFQARQSRTWSGICKKTGN